MKVMCRDREIETEIDRFAEIDLDRDRLRR